MYKYLKITIDCDLRLQFYDTEIANLMTRSYLMGCRRLVTQLVTNKNELHSRLNLLIESEKLDIEDKELLGQLFNIRNLDNPEVLRQTRIEEKYHDDPFVVESMEQIGYLILNSQAKMILELDALLEERKNLDGLCETLVTNRYNMLMYYIKYMYPVCCEIKGNEIPEFYFYIEASMNFDKLCTNNIVRNLLSE